jgi:hypothetical protein
MLLDLSSGAYFELDEFGMAIWMRLDGRTAVPSIARKLAARYEAPPRTVQRDVTAFIVLLRKRRLLVPDTRRAS